VPQFENREKKDHEVPATTETGLVWKSSNTHLASNQGCNRGRLREGEKSTVAPACCQ
jgi:hypothetical protein